MMKKIIGYFRYFLLAIILSLLVMPIRGNFFSLFGLVGFSLATLIGSILFFVFTWICLRKNKKGEKEGYIVLAILLGASLELPFTIKEFSNTLGAQPTLYFKYLAVLAAYWSYSAKHLYAKILVGVVFLGSVLWMSYDGYDCWLHKLRYDTWRGNVEINKHRAPIIVTNDQGDSVDIKSFRGKYLLIDCWFTSCGACYQNLTVLQEFDDSYNGQDIDFIALHFWLENEDYLTGKNILTERNYTLPAFSTPMKDNVFFSELKLRSFPATLIFNPEGELVFHGSMNFAKRYMKKLELL